MARPRSTSSSAAAPRPATLKTLAASLGLGITTVSDILLRGKTNYKTATIARVREAAEAAGFRPNALAQGMRGQKTQTIGLLITMNIVDPFFAELVNRLESRFEQAGFMVILSISENDIEKDKRALRFFESRRVDGLVIGPIYNLRGTIDQSSHYQTSLPTVKILSSPENLTDCVSINHRRMGRIAVEHFLARGHSRMGYLMCPDFPRKHQGSTPFRGFYEALHRRRLFRDEWIWIDNHPAAERAYAQMQHILATAPRTSLPTAFFCHNDYCASGAMAAVREAGLDIPGHFSFMGCDNIKTAPFFNPPLTTIDLKPVELADHAFSLLIERMRHPRQPARYVEIEPALIERNSISAPVPH